MANATVKASVNFKPGVRTDASGKLYSNGLVFATHAQALTSAESLMAKWTAVISVGVVETSDPVNYAMVDGVPVAKDDIPDVHGNE